mmetsp:Transcript_18341/g.37097  ORF Transcript_18341/g.37097 Transcript_18341/m.37097 type:complete len:80 (-) Transcript_18341:95-334(-)
MQSSVLLNTHGFVLSNILQQWPTPNGESVPLRVVALVSTACRLSVQSRTLIILNRIAPDIANMVRTLPSQQPYAPRPLG